ncbi:MAG TPA: DUF4097 family beta strand repeat-containing protein [Longimicrobiaceae bacterium]
MIRILGLAGTAILAGMAPLPHRAGLMFPPRTDMTETTIAPAQQRDFHWTNRVAQGERVQINNLIGDIVALPADGDQVTVDAVRSGPGADQVRIEVVRRSDGYVICAVYPEEGESASAGAQRDPCSGRRTPVDRNGPSVAFTVRVPAGVALNAQTLYGGVRASGLRGPVSARAVSGDVRVTSSGPVEANSVEGNVFASMGRLGDEPLEFRAMRGDVTIEVPADAQADFYVNTSSGRVQSDFPVQPGRGPRHGRDREAPAAAHGRSVLVVSTTTGNVTLRRAHSPSS